MDKIVVKIEPGMAEQTIMYYDKSAIIGSERHEMCGLVEYLMHKCYDEECFNLHLVGPWTYLEGVVMGINGEEQTLYRMNKINIEVN